TPFDADEETTRVMNEWFAENSGLREVYRPTTADHRAVLEYLGDYHAAHMDLAFALLEDGDLDGAARHIERARELGTPCPGLALNYLAVIAQRRGDYDAMMSLFSEAAKTDPQHYVLIRNIHRARAWFKEDGLKKGLPLELEARHDFQLLERTMQPTLPGPLPPDYATWGAPLAAEAAPDFVKTPDVEGSQKPLGPSQRNKLKVVS
ncbi:MAG: tetratricopeptide repeat protein, partial [Myxococcales bacterium]|nr:tetratricopeptide repeat protein [Myxococcales bacterium]